ncbi:MAG: hypothetical protein ACUVWJ_06225 [Spirochaetota bacterium]
MHYIDLLLSFILFAMGIFFIIRNRMRMNRWIILLALLFFPVTLINYYFPELDRNVYKDISLLQIIVYPLMKLIILLSLFRYFRYLKVKGR